MTDNTSTPQATNAGRTVIVGGVAGGMSTAARLRRRDENMEIIVLESSGHVSFANCGLPYYLGGVIEQRDELLLQTPESLKARFNIDVRVNTTASDIDREAKTIKANPHDGEAYELSYDYLVLSPGADPFTPPIPGIERAYTLRNIEDTDAINNALESDPKSAVIIGGGFIGLEVAENFKHRGIDTTIVEASPQIMTPLDPEMAQIVADHLEDNGVRVLTSEQVVEVTDTAVKTKAGTELTADLVISAVGVRPSDKLARDAGLDVGERGGILIDEQLRTSDPSIFAVGDATLKKDANSGAPVLIPLAQTANRHGRIVADVISGRDNVATLPTMGTSVVELFGLAATSVGWNEKRTIAELGEDGPFDIVHLHPMNHAGYYPGANTLNMKVIYNTETDEILGAQVIGKEGADKRIDVIATAMQAGMKAYQLADVELAYSPQVGSAKDPINLAGFIIDNKRDGQQTVQWHEVPDLMNDGWMMLDVRTENEFNNGTIPDAVNIPVDELRDRVDEIPENSNVIVTCQVGLRGNVATQQLRARGINVANLDGGYVTWTHGTGSQAANEDN